MSKATLIEFAKRALPRWLFEASREEELINAFGLIFEQAEINIDFLVDQTFLTRATGIFLDLHAKDRGTARRENETDGLLSLRLRVIDDAVTRPALLTEAQRIVDDYGVSGTVAMFEFRHLAYFGEFSSYSGTGGVFGTAGSDATFEPTAGFQGVPFGSRFPFYRWQLVISGAASGGNDGTFETTGMLLDAARYTNGGQVAEADPTVSWTVEKLDQDGNLADGFGKAFLSRGYRMGARAASGFVMILPFGCTDALVSQIDEMLRQKKAAGMRSTVECRLIA